MDGSRATSFGGWAHDYDRWRPTYPAPVLDWLVPRGATAVAEVGAGTGKLTDRLVGRGFDLDVVEPDGRMLALIADRHPGVRTHVAGADDLPLGDASVDAVLVADAWHWFPQERAAAEVTRVLRQGGWLGCVWNVARPQHDWEWRALRLDRELSARQDDDPDPLHRLGLTSGRAEVRAFPWTWTLTPTQWRGFVSTVSHVALLAEPEREATLDEVEELVGRACAEGGTDTVPLHHEALCVRWHPSVSR